MKKWVVQALNLLLVSACLSLAACAAVAPVAQSTQIEGHSASGRALRISTPFTFRPALYSATFPAGVYLPTFEDKDGVYFRAPAQILTLTIAGGGVMDGGIYVPKTSWKSYRAYLTDGSIDKFDISVPVALEVVPWP
jgi:hypothetical protein